MTVTERRRSLLEWMRTVGGLPPSTTECAGLTIYEHCTYSSTYSRYNAALRDLRALARNDKVEQMPGLPTRWKVLDRGDDGEAD